MSEQALRHKNNAMKIALYILALFALSCSSTDKAVTDSDEKKEEVVEQVKEEMDKTPVVNKAVYPVLSYRTTQCFGKCPTYEVIYYSNGQISYEGIAHTKKAGRYTRDLDKIEKADMQKLLNFATLDNAKDNYDPYITDASVTHLTYIVPGELPYKTKGVMSWPDNIQPLIDYIKNNFTQPDEKSWKKANAIMSPNKMKN